MITTCKQYVDFLVSNGVHAGLAKAMITEFYSIDHEEDKLVNAEEDGPITFDEATALEDFNKGIVEGYNVHVTDEGIVFDGHVAFDLEGNRLPDMD